MTVIAITGSREGQPTDSFEKIMDYLMTLYYPDVKIVVGDAQGTDSMVRVYCKFFGIPCEKFVAEWDKYGKAAGHIRNGDIFIKGMPDFVVAFPGGVGTDNMCQQAKKRGVPLIDFRDIPYS